MEKRPAIRNIYKKMQEKMPIGIRVKTTDCLINKFCHLPATKNNFINTNMK